MAIKDILLTLTSYPDPTPPSVAVEAISIAEALGAHLTAIACEVHVEIPGRLFSGSIANIPAIIAGEAEKSRRFASELLSAFDKAANRAGIPFEAVSERCPTHAVPELLTRYARLHDLTIVPVPDSYDQWYAESVIFGSGRPTLVLPVSTGEHRPLRFGALAVAWDSSRTAARAVSDALPLLGISGEVHIITVLNEKRLPPEHSGEALARNLARHDINVVLDEVDADENEIGDVLEAYAKSHHIDMLVMGAYGHSRWREFILGGATKSLLSKPPLPILFSH